MVNISLGKSAMSSCLLGTGTSRADRHFVSRGVGETDSAWAGGLGLSRRPRRRAFSENRLWIRRSRGRSLG